jgi:GT2 family glycosyltransferase
VKHTEGSPNSPREINKEGVSVVKRTYSKHPAAESESIDLSVLIVNWRSAPYVESCVKSIYRETKNINFEIIIVDNGSFDECERIVTTNYPEVTFVQSERNIGFGRANNLAFGYSRGKNILFLNPDTEVLGPAIETMLSHLQSLPEAGVVGCCFRDSNLVPYKDIIHVFPTALNQALYSQFFIRLLSNCRVRGRKPFFPKIGADPEEVDTVSGACLMVKRDLFEQVGMFSHEYFMYTEDTDLCYKARQRGFKTFFVGRAEILHHGCGSTRNRKDGFAAVLNRESVYTFLNKTKGEAYARRFKRTMTLAAAVRLCLLCASFPALLCFGKKEGVTVRVKRWWKVLRWSLGLERWARRMSPTHSRKA